MEYYIAIQRTKHLIIGETRRWLGPDSRLVGHSARSSHVRKCVQERNGPRGCCRLPCIQATLTVIILKNDEQPIPQRKPPGSLHTAKTKETAIVRDRTRDPRSSRAYAVGVDFALPRFGTLVFPSREGEARVRHSYNGHYAAKTPGLSWPTTVDPSDRTTFRSYFGPGLPLKQ